MLYLYIDRVFKTCSTCLHLYPLYFDVKYIHIRIHIIFHENFTQKTISTASIYILQGNSTAAATVGNMMSIACLHASMLLLMRTRARRAYCKKCRVHIALEIVGRPNIPVLRHRLSPFDKSATGYTNPTQSNQHNLSSHPKWQRW